MSMSLDRGGNLTPCLIGFLKSSFKPNQDGIWLLDEKKDVKHRYFDLILSLSYVRKSKKREEIEKKMSPT